MVGHAVSQAEALEHRASTLSQAVAAFRLQQGTADEAVALVNKAVALHKTTSRDSFCAALLTRRSPTERDMYVFVLDAGGTYLAFGGNRAKVGTRVQDIPGVCRRPAGERHRDPGRPRSPGWVVITNPAGAVQTKMSYVGDWYVGCGVYWSHWPRGNPQTSSFSSRDLGIAFRVALSARPLSQLARAPWRQQPAACSVPSPTTAVTAGRDKAVDDKAVDVEASACASNPSSSTSSRGTRWRCCW